MLSSVSMRPKFSGGNQDEAGPSSLGRQDSFSLEDVSKLTQEVSKQAFKDHRDILALSEQHPKAKGIVGKLPDDWGAQPEQQKGLFAAFGQFVQKLRNESHGKVVTLNISGKKRFLDRRSNDSGDDPAPLIYLSFNQPPEHMVADGNLPEALQAARVFSEKRPVSFKYINNGNLGTVHQFKINGQPYALKTFFMPDDPTIKTGRENYHGSPIEPNRALYLNGLVPDAQFTKCYWADLKNQYMVSRFQACTGPKPKATIELPALGLKHHDLKEDEENVNTINGWVVDYGGISLDNPRLMPLSDPMDIEPRNLSTPNRSPRQSKNGSPMQISPRIQSPSSPMKED